MNYLQSPYQNDYIASHLKHKLHSAKFILQTKAIDTKQATSGTKEEKWGCETLGVIIPFHMQ